MKIGRKILAAVALCMVMGLAVWPDRAKEVRAEVFGDFEYQELEDGTVEITKYTGTDAEVMVPGMIDGKIVTSIGDEAFRDYSSITGISISDGVTSIGDCAFYDCASLAEISLPTSMTSIGKSVFRNCSSMTEINIPDGVTSIGAYAFSGCRNLTGINIPDGVTSIEEWVFFGCSMTEINIPDGVTSIGFCAFGRCSRLTKINISDDVTSIGSYAFESCSSLTEINIPDGVTHIGNDAFKYCSSLMGISIPDSVTSIEFSTFEGCSSLTGCSISDGVTSIGFSAFEGCNSLTRCSIPDGVTSIEDCTFKGCSSLTEIKIPDGVMRIEDSAFQGCSTLSDVYYSGTEDQWKTISIATGNDPLLNANIHYNSIPTEDTSKDYQYKTLSDGTIEITKYIGTNTIVNIPAQIDNKNVTSIGDEVFYGCSSLTEINIPDGVTSIGKSAFYGCSGLTEINIPDGVTSIENQVFYECSSLIKIYIPNGVTSIGDEVFCGCKNLTEISIPDGVTSIGEGAFSDCSKLTEVSIPDGVASIGEFVFYGCSGLTEINIPDSVTSIGEFAFHRCDSLTEINIPDGVTSIEGFVFVSCSSLTEINIPDGVTNIGRYAFVGCSSLTEINIPNGVTSISSNAFGGCDNLSDVYYSGTEDQWKAISIDTGNDPLLNANIHYNSIPTEDISRDYQYKTLSNGTIEITKYIGSNTTANIPAKIDGKQVTSIGESAFSGCRNLTEIIIPSGVTTIGDAAFDACSGLTKITIPDSVTSIGRSAFFSCKGLQELTIPDSVTTIGYGAFGECSGLTKITMPSGIAKIEGEMFFWCTKLEELTIPDRVTTIDAGCFRGCGKLKAVTIPVGMANIEPEAFWGCESLTDVYYSGTKKQWEQIKIEASGNENLLHATIHYKEDPTPTPPEPTIPEEPILPAATTAKQELERLLSGDPLSLEPAFHHYLSQEQTDILERYLYTWLADINYTYRYAGSSSIRENIRKRSGIDPQGDFASGKEQAITHISAETKYGRRTFEITLDLGALDSSGNLYPSFGAMRFEVLPKGGAPSDVPTDGQIGQSSYGDIAAFAASVARACEDSLHGTFQWESLSDEMVSGILVDKTVTEIIGNKNGSFSDGIFTIYAKPLFTYSKKVTIACPVDVYVYRMDGQEAGTIVNNKPSGTDENIRLDVNGDTKTVYLTGNDYYLNLRGTDTGTMKYEVEEIANEEVCRNVQFLELQLKKDMQYEGYVFRPLNIDSDLYALRTVNGPGSGEVTYADKDSLEPVFKKVQGMSLSQQNTSMHTDKTVQLNASFFPLDATNPNLVWISDNPSVASVGSDGLVTALGAGRATITVMTRDGSFLKQSCIVDVAGNQNQTPDLPSTKPDAPSSQPGTSTQPTRPSTPDSSGGTGTQPEKPSGQPEDPPKDDSPVVAKLYYIVQFHANGGTNLSRRTMTLLNDDKLGILPKVQRKAYLFSGWYTQQTGGARIYGDKKLNEATTLYARWTKAKAPAKAVLRTLKSTKKGQAKAGFQEVDGAAGYQVQYARNKTFASAKMKTAGAAAKAKTITGLKAGKKYYIRVRAYRLDSMGNKIYGAYSAVKSVKVKA